LLIQHPQARCSIPFKGGVYADFDRRAIKIGISKTLVATFSLFGR
jgi:hypothetical protein